MGTNIKEFLQLVEDFVDMIGMQMKDFQDIYEVTENLGEPLIFPWQQLCALYIPRWFVFTFIRPQSASILIMSLEKF